VNLLRILQKRLHLCLEDKRLLEPEQQCDVAATSEIQVAAGCNEFLNNALFVGYAPHDAPRYCAIVIYERLPSGHYGADATGRQVAELLAEAMHE